MDIQIQGTKVLITGDRIIGFALNNLVNRFEATTDKDETWNYQLYVHMILKDTYNIIQLYRDLQNPSLLFVDLTKDMLPYDGRYEMQFLATNGMQRSFTEKFEVWVKNSLDPAIQYTPVPSEFYQIENDIRELNQHPPIPGNDGYWMIWNTISNQYEKSDLPVGGGGGADKTYIFTQSTPSNKWEIQHNLNKFPSVTIIDSGNNAVVGEIEYINNNKLFVTFSNLFSGKAYMN